MPKLAAAVLAAAVLAAGLHSAIAGAQETRVLRASHQFPGGVGDLRDEMVRIVARMVNDADVGLEIQIYPGQSLYRAREQWAGLVSGQLDISAFPLDYAGGRHPEFNATLMPGLVRNHEHAARLNESPFMERIRQIIEDEGAVVLSDVWLAGGFASRQNCILEPADVQGQVTRAAGRAFERMLAAAGASISSMPSSEVYAALQTGILDAANTSSESFMSFRLYELVTCVTPPGEHALWFMYEPILMSKTVWESLTPEQQAVLEEAGAAAETFAREAAIAADQRMVDTYRDNGVEVVFMTAEQAEAWRAVARESAYKVFAETVPEGAALLEMALSVE